LSKLISKSLELQFIRFLLVGLLNTVFGYSVYAILIWAGFSYPLAILFGTILGALFNYKTIGALVFRSKNNKLLYRFLMVYAVIYLVNIISIKFLKILIPNDYISQALLLPFIALLSYSLNRKFVFKKC